MVDTVQVEPADRLQATISPLVRAGVSGRRLGIVIRLSGRLITEHAALALVMGSLRRWNVEARDLADSVMDTGRLVEGGASSAAPGAVR
jgi:hypothetical protein